MSDTYTLVEQVKEAEARVTVLEQQACRCAYCGEAVTGALNAFTGEGHERLIDHILACDKRPEMRAFEQIQALEARNAALEERWEALKAYGKRQANAWTDTEGTDLLIEMASLERPTEDATKAQL